jgi:hypothetical protein
MEIGRLLGGKSPMDAAARIEWEWYRVGGKRRYLLRNVIAWTAALEAPYVIIRVVLVALDSGFGRHLLDLVGELVFTLLMITLVNWAWLSAKWNRNEAAYQRTANYPSSGEAIDGNS